MGYKQKQEKVHRFFYIIQIKANFQCSANWGSSSSAPKPIIIILISEGEHTHNLSAIIRMTCRSTGTFILKHWF